MEEELEYSNQTVEKKIVAQYSLGSTGAQLTQATQGSGRLYARLQACLEIGLIVTGLYAMYSLLPHYILGIDAEIRFRAISALLQHGIVPNMKYSIVGPVFSIPFWLLGNLYQSPIWWCERYNLFVFAYGLLFLYLLLKDCIDRSLLRKFLLLLIVASMFANHITNYYSEVFTAICVGVGILTITMGPRLAGWCAIVLGVINTPAALLGLCCMVFKHIYDNKRLRYTLAIIAAAGLILAEGWMRRGSPLSNGYEKEPGFSFPFIGLISILFSFGKGLLFFAPGLLLPIRSTILNLKQDKKLEMYRAYVLWIAFLVGMVLLYSSWWAWYGGWFWGPRFFLLASIPASCALAVRLHYLDASLGINLLTAIVFALSVWVGIDGAVFDQKSLQGVCFRMGDVVCIYQPQLSPLWRPFFVNIRLPHEEMYYVAFCLLVAAYLAIPLLGIIVEQTIEVVKNFGSTIFKRGMWHF